MHEAYHPPEQPPVFNKHPTLHEYHHQPQLILTPNMRVTCELPALLSLQTRCQAGGVQALVALWRLPEAMCSSRWSDGVTSILNGRDIAVIFASVHLEGKAPNRLLFKTLE